jgi:hypothetical protein
MVLAKFDDGTGFSFAVVSKIAVSPSEPDRLNLLVSCGRRFAPKFQRTDQLEI